MTSKWMAGSWAVVIAGLLAGAAQAGVITWGGGNGNWNAGSGWVGGVLPGPADTGVVASGTPTANADFATGAPTAIRIDAGGKLKIGYTIGTTYSFVLNGGTIAIGDSGTINGPVSLTANSTILNDRNNSNRSLAINGNITEDAPGRKLTFNGYPTTSGSVGDSTRVGGTNSYSGGTDILGPVVIAQTAGALGTGPVNVSGGRLQLSYAGSYTFGTITLSNSGGAVIIGANPTNTVMDLRGGTLQHANNYGTIDSTNSVTISNTVGIWASGTNSNNPFTIKTSIGGAGKAVLNEYGPWNGTSYSSQGRVVIQAVQNWTGGTDVKGLTDINTGGSLPAGTVTVYALNPAKIPYAPDNAVLRLYNSSALGSGTDLVLLRDATNSWYGTLKLGANVTVHTLTVDGTLMPAGTYKQSDLPNYIVNSGTYTIRVLAPDTPPTAINDLAATDAQLAALTLRWSAPRDELDAGNTAVRYDIRYSTSAITEANFPAATAVTQSLVPKAPGAAETLVVNGLTPATTYYFAIKSIDDGGNASALSNVVMVQTLVPDLTAPAAIEALRAQDVDTRKLRLVWTASGDDGNTGTAAAYDIRMSTSAITAANFAAAQVVAQNLMPKVAGQTETLPVTGLTPGMTYYFAMKVADETPLWSGISNVLQQATLPPDVTPPGAITDLATGGRTAFSADLTWTATGDDGSVGTATRYEIRYSLSPIVEANWTAATIAWNSLVPQAAGGTEHFTVNGLQPSTTYYFGVKTMDEEGNTSGLSNVVSGTTGPLPALPVVTSVTIVEKAGVTTSNYPVTLSMVFKKGDVPSNVIVRAAGNVLVTQTDVKVRWDDGSVKHALVSFVLPSLQAGSQVSAEFLAGGPNANGHPISRADLLARDFDAQLTISIGGVPTTISARQMLASAAGVETWLAGDICSEFLVKDFNTNVAGQLSVQYRVRAYNSYSGIRVDTVVENCWTQYRGNVTYDFNLALGQASPVSVFSKTGFAHNFNARWHKVFWQGATPPAIQVKYDLPYRIATGLVPRYDTSVVVDAATMSSRYASWLSKPHDVMDSGNIETYFPTTGGREEIGIYPTWAARYLLSMDDRMRDITLNCGDLSGSIPIHLRESDAARSFYGHVLSINDRPTVWVGWWDYSSQSAADKLPAPVGSTTTVWSVDGAHQGSFAYIPYLFSGDYYYLEEMYYWAGWDVANSNYGYRGASQGWLVEQTRGLAWMVRNLADAANMAPDGDLEKPYLLDKLNNNLNRWVGMYVNSPNYPAIRYWEDQSNYGADGGRPDSDLVANCRYYTSPWMDDYVIAALGHLRDIGYNTQALVDWFGDSLIKRFSVPGYNPYRGAPYHIPVQYDDGAGHAIPYATWTDINNAFVDPIGPSSFPGSDYAGSYNFSARGAMTWVVHLPGGRSTWNWLNSNLHAAPQNSFAVDPTWALLPPPYKPGDINGDGYVNVGDLQALVAAWGSQAGPPASSNWNPQADCNGDSFVNVGDLQLLVANWGKS